MRELDLVEYRPAEAIRLTVKERDLLRRLVPDLTITPTLGTDDMYDLVPGSHVGVVRTPTLDVRISPKLPIDRVLFLLSYGLDAGAFRPDVSGFGTAPDLLEAIVPVFTAHVHRAFRRGIVQGYRTLEDTLPGVRGRIRFDAQVTKRFGIFPPVEVRYDEYTEDIEANRLIKAAIDRLRRMRLRSDSARRQLRAFDETLARVASVDYPPTRIPEVRFDRLTEHYRPAVVLARLVLQHGTIHTRRGSTAATAFLMDMNNVFETFVTVALREALLLDERAFPEEVRGRSLHLAAGGRISLKPDLSWWRSGRCVFVGDVKYKRTQVKGVPNADLYQLLAYTVATDVPAGLLIYAAGEAQPATYEVVHDDKILQVAVLDLAGGPKDVLAQIATVADCIRKIASPAPDRLTAPVVM